MMENEQNSTQKITPFLWFKEDAGEVMKFYASVFKDAVPGPITRFGGNGDGREGSFATGTLQLQGQNFMIFSGNAPFSFTPAVSFFVNCETQQEIDTLWEKLTAGGAPSQCGWLTDKFGVSWQLVPTGLEKLLHGPDKEKSGRAMSAMLQMTKLDIGVLEKAYQGQE